MKPSRSLASPQLQGQGNRNDTTEAPILHSFRVAYFHITDHLLHLSPLSSFRFRISTASAQ